MFKHFLDAYNRIVNKHTKIPALTAPTFYWGRKKPQINKSYIMFEDEKSYERI